LDYTEEEIRQALPTLKDTHQAIIIKVYGKELKENNFDILNNEEKILLHSAKFALNSKLKRLRAKTDPLFKTLNDYFPDYLITEIKRVLTLLDSKHVKIIEKAYGKDLEKVNFSKLTSEQRRQLLLARYALKNKLKQTENELKLGQKKLIDYFSDYTYKEIQRGVSNLPEKYQYIIRQVFGENLRKTCGSKLSKESQALLLKAIKELDKKYLIKNKKTKLKDFFEYFEEETLDEIKFAFSAVALDYQDILVKAYGEDFNENNTCYLSSKERHFLAAARTEIKRKLKSLKNGSLSNCKKLIDYYDGYSKEEILKAFSLLNKNYQLIIIKTYGENFLENHYNDLDSSEKKLLRAARTEIRRKLKSLQTKKSPKFKILFDYYQGYSEEEILRAFSRLDVSYKNIIEKAYGKNLNEIKNKNLTDEENGLLKIAKDKLLKQLQTPHCLENDICNFLKVSEINNDFLATLENSTLKDLEYIFEYILVKKTNLTEEERKYYSAVLLKLKFLYATKDDLEIEENSDWESISKHLDKEKCHSYIMTLNPTTQVIINAKLGFLDDKKIYSYKTIAEVTQIPVEDIHQIVMNTLWDIRNFIAENDYVKKPTKK